MHRIEINHINKEISDGAIFALTGLKMISDMFWQYPALDMLLLGCASALLLIRLSRSRVSYGFPDIAYVVLFCLLTVSFAKSNDGLTIFIKMSSSIILYFLGRESSDSFNSAVGGILAALPIILLLNVATFLSGAGFQIWGEANTFSGLYYFKTDLASAMSILLMTSLYFFEKKHINVLVSLICILFIVLSNARVYYIITIIILMFYVLYSMNIRIRARFLLIGAIGMLGALWLLNLLFSTDVFKDLGFVGIHFNSISDLFDASNTQGRNIIWDALFDRVLNGTIAEQLFGFDLTGDTVFVNGAAYGSHSLYFGLLYNVGIIGSMCFISAILYWAHSIIVLTNTEFRKSYFLLSLMSQVLISGISVHVFQYTGNMWIPMLISGMAVTLGRQNNRRTSTQSLYRMQI